MRVIQISAILTVIFLMSNVTSSTTAATSAAPPQPAATAGVNVDHGRYLAEHVAMCVECHSPRDESGRIVHGREFFGAPLPLDPPRDWAMRAPRNRGLPGYTDEQAFRLLMEGAIARDGRQLQAPMPRFRMTRQDAADVIAFLRSLP